MSFEFNINPLVDRAIIYKDLGKQLKGLVEGEPDLIANLSNIAAAIKQFVPFHWVGFYLLKDDELVLGPFQGPVACTRIQKGKGVCGKAWEEKALLIVPDVNVFPGHIACSDKTNSELVVPILVNGKVWAVLDVDSTALNDFGVADRSFFEDVSVLIGKNIEQNKWCQ